MEPGADASPRIFRLRGGRGVVALHENGLRLPAGFPGLGERFTLYSDVTHLALSGRGLRVATRKSVLGLRRRRFADPDDVERLARELVDRIGAGSDGPAQLARMRTLDDRVRVRPPMPVTWSLIGLCLALHVAQVVLGPVVFELGYFGSSLVRAGELWRLVTANVLHAFPGLPAHLFLNLLGLLVMGLIVERGLGSARTLLVVGGAALGATVASVLMDYERAVGASGIVFGLVGAALWMELRFPERLPSLWRVPRRLFLVAVAVDLVVGVLVPAVAGAAHLGGLVGGALVAAGVAGPGLRREPVRGWVTAANALVLAASIASLGFAAGAVSSGGKALARLGARLVPAANIDPLTLNNYAWLIVEEPGPTAEALEVARRLAERAVEETGREDPNLLDTLAEVHFAAGELWQAVATIDEAIQLAPHEPYFREQRRRFTGERAPDDRPTPREELFPRQPLPPGHPPIPDTLEDRGIEV